MPVAVPAVPDQASVTDVDSLIPEAQGSQNSPKKARPPQKNKSKTQADTLDQPVAGSSSAADDSTWAWRSLTETTASKVTPVFTKDGSYFLSASGDAVKIYSVATGQVVSTLTPSESGRPSTALGYGRAVTCMMLSPHNPFQLLTGSMDGCVRLWDFVDAVPLRTIDLAQPVLYLTAHEKFKDEVVVTTQRGVKKTGRSGIPTDEFNAAIISVSLIPTEATATQPVQKSSATKIIGKTRAPRGLSYSPSGSWLVALGGHKAYICRTSDLKAGFTKLVSPDKLTCLAFHPREDYFATGDTKGIVRLWYCLNDNIPVSATGVEKTAPTTTLHWHAHTVASLAFTANGAYLLSGGEEAVLVIWQLHTGKKEYVPRVGAPISSITLSTASTREEEYLLGLSDASFAFVRSGTLRISRTIAKVKLDPAVSHDRPTTSTSVPLAAHATSSSLILPSSHPSTLQTYSPLTATLIAELEVTPTNRISRRDEKSLEPGRVEFAVTSESGDWLATVDSRLGDDSFRGEVYLKLWYWDRKVGSWSLNTRIDKPHGLKKVTSVSFRPRCRDPAALNLVTTGQDGKIKVWGIRSTSTKSGEAESFWVARSSIHFRSEIPSHACWSHDGSLLAVAFGQYVVLYNPDTAIALRTIVCPECEVVQSVHFVGKASRYLVIRGHNDLVLWDLVTESVCWHHSSSQPFTHVFSHPREDTFMVFSSTGQATGQLVTKAMKLSPSSWTPIKTHTLPFHLHSIAKCPARWLQSNDPSSFAFVGITHQWNAVLFGDQIRLADEDESAARGLVSAAPIGTHSLFQDIFGKSALSDAATKSPAVTAPQTSAPWKGKEVERVFDTPAYLLPPLGTLFDPLMDEFLVERSITEVPNEGEAHDEQDGDVEMEGVDEPILVGNRLDRVVNEDEMTSMIALFKSHALHSSTSAPTPQKPALVNGHHKPSAPSTPTVNGIPKLNGVSSTPRSSKPVASEETTGTPKSKASPAVKAGQKRKKSLD